MADAAEPVYEIPYRYRKMENMHIIFWLFKDVSWCLTWKVLGIAMIVPTLLISIIIAWRTRDIKSELAHNLAVTFWITANSYWMISEFFHFDETIIWQNINGKHMAIIPFGIGLLILVYYYLIQKPKESQQTGIATM
jgi:hypothetical protein